MTGQAGPEHHNTSETSASPFLLLPFLFPPSIIPLSFPPDSPPSVPAGPIACSSLFGAAFLFPASNPPKMLSLPPSTDYKQTLTSCFSEPRRRHKGPSLPFSLFLPETSFAFAFFFFKFGFFFFLQLHRFCCFSCLLMCLLPTFCILLLVAFMLFFRPCCRVARRLSAFN